MLSGIAGIQAWRDSERPDPCVTRNSSDHVVKALGITWQPGQVAFHPGPNGEFAAVRWTAPVSEKVRFSAVFTSIAEAATTDLYVLHNGRSLFDERINLDGKGPEARFTATIDVKEGDTVDSVCGWGNKNHGADTTALKVGVVTASGTIWDIDRDFSSTQNPAGAWSFGALRPGDRPDCKTFARFTGDVSSTSIGSISNPGESVWQDILSDQHPYQRVPHTATTLQTLRTLHGNGNPVWLSEYGIGSAMDLLRIVRWYEQAGKTDVEDARLYQSWRDQFLADWKRYRLDQVFDRPEDFFTQSISRMAGQRLLGLNAIRSNPSVVGHSITGTLDQGMTAEGVWTTFRELKPGATDALFDAWAPCDGAFSPNRRTSTGEHRFTSRPYWRTRMCWLRASIPSASRSWGPTSHASSRRESPSGLPIRRASPNQRWCCRSSRRTWSSTALPGLYRFLATFERGAAACGEEVKFCVDIPSAEMAPVDNEIHLVGSDVELSRWLTTHGIKNRPFIAGQPQTRREVILASGQVGGDPALVFSDLARRIARGSTAIFLTTGTYSRGKESTGWLPLKAKGRVSQIARWLYHSDEWAKRHPIFEGLLAGGLLDYDRYRDLISDVVFMDIEPAADPVAGGINASWGYQSGLIVGTYDFGAGSFILNSLLIRENLGKVPQAERLIRNMLRFAARNSTRPLAELPADFVTRLKVLGY